MDSDLAAALGADLSAPLPSSRAEDYQNDYVIEAQWAEKCGKQSETYFKLLTAIDPKQLRLTRRDDDIYEDFLQGFSDMQIDVVRVNDLHSPEAKAMWRAFCMKYEGQIEDFNFGTLLRLDVAGEYSQENTILVPRVQFYAIEIARNRRGLNNCHYEAAQKAKKDSS
ncbi:protein PBDC1-like [Sycon ciliatum]|uniref:protein PBDC1-like n=1 Tax=Sycon ciliatum TaxID=27933 RepID=UPI0020AC6349|eukprot:scpid72423/ scgid18322/ UPF0368 protein Cxorf26